METVKISPLQLMSETTLTDYWNDSCAVEELTYAVARGAVGATSNPTIVLDVLKKDLVLWKDRIKTVITQNPTWTEEQVTWKMIEEVAVHGSKVLLPVYEREKGRKGLLSIQTNPQNYRNAEALVQQAVHFHSLAPNLQVKIPATKAGIEAIEEATYQGVNINATVSFCVPQSLAVAEAVERGLKRREAAGQDISGMCPVSTMMVGRLDDWLEVLVKRDGILTEPGYVQWAGVAAFKKAYGIFKKKGYHTRLLVAAYRHHLHWTEFIGGDVAMTIPYPWQKQFNASDFEIVERMDVPVAKEIVDELYRKFTDFRRAYDEDGLTHEEFDTFGPTVRTLRAFIASYHELVEVIRNIMLPNPDVKL